MDATEDLLPQGNRLRILTPEEYELLWGLPQFSTSDRELFFSVTPREQVVFDRVRTPRTQLHFLLLLGYFKARQRFFVVDEDTMSDDIDHLVRRYLSAARPSNLTVSKHTRLSHVSWILELFGFRQMAQAERVDLERRALETARVSSRPVYML
ncbi:MAG: DUF4158 domain-containing protein, partial [Pseudomonadota bacterium]